MNFSETFKQTGQFCRFSPDGVFIANAVQYRLIIRDVKTLQIVHLFTCLDAIQYIEWSPDSSLVLCGMYKRGLVQVWSVEQPEWTCKIDEGSAGVTGVRWSPDSRHVLTTAEFGLRMTVWSLVNKSVSYIKYPKQCQKGLDFDTRGKYLALAERRDCKDYISIFDCTCWQLVKHFETDTDDLAGLSWSPDGRVLCVWENCLQYKVLIYSVDGRNLSTYSAYDLALGVKGTAWSPTSQFLAIGSYDQKVRILNHITWKTVAEHAHPLTIDGSAVVAYKEVESKPPHLHGEAEPPGETLFRTQSKYEIVQGNLQVPNVKPDQNKANPKMGVGSLEFSSDGRYLYTQNDNMPHALWIWDVPNLCQAVLLLQTAPVKCVAWEPGKSRLALCTGNGRVYMWSPAGSLSVEVPVEVDLMSGDCPPGPFQVTSLCWHPDGDILCLMSRDLLCVCFLAVPKED